MPNSVLCLVCFILAGVGAWVVARFAYRWGMTDIPSDRSSHTQPIPKGGGIGILAAFFVSTLYVGIPSSFWIPSTLLALFSFCGDRIEFSTKLRLSLQFIAAIVLLFGINGGSQNQISSFLLTLAMAVFIVGTANFYNFMDGINGIAGITGVVGFGLLAFFASFSGADSSFVILTTCMSLSCLAFLPFNIPRAKVFMGDVGSIFIGFVFAAMVVVVSKNFLDFVCLASFLFPFYADELTTMMIRLKDGENLLRPHRRHLYQLLANEKGISHWKISMGYGLFQLMVGVTILLVKPYGNIMVFSLLAAYFGAFIVVSSAIRKNLTTSA